MSNFSVKLGDATEDVPVVSSSGVLIPSPQQQDIINFIQRDRRNLLIEAVAGAGKTTILKMIMKYLTGFVDYIVFNKKNEVEIQPAIAVMNAKGEIPRNLMAGTYHSFGWKAWYKSNPGCKIEGFGERNAGYRKMDRIFEIMAGEVGSPFWEGTEPCPPQLKRFVSRLVTLAKQRALGLDMVQVAFDDFMDIVVHFGLDEDLFKEEYGGSSEMDSLIKQGINIAADALGLSAYMSREVIDFEDMIYMPLFRHCNVWQNDWVLGDEQQDTNEARRLLQKKMLKPGGRYVGVGDRHQSIYGFTGADADALDRLKVLFNCHELPLSVSYRCPVVGVSLAQKWVSQIQAHPSARQGSHTTISRKKFDEIEKFSSEEVVLCRNNAPLVEMAFSLIRRGIPCYVEGRDIGKEIQNLAMKWKAKSLTQLKERVTAHKTKEVAKLVQKNLEGQADTLADRCDTLIALIDGMPKGATIADLHARIETMFQDTKPENRTCLILSSVHKAKGLEWHRVYLLGRNMYMPSKYARKDWQRKQEDNLCYVAVTRFTHELVEVTVTKEKMPVIPPPRAIEEMADAESDPNEPENEEGWVQER